MPTEWHRVRSTDNCANPSGLCCKSGKQGSCKKMENCLGKSRVMLFVNSLQQIGKQDETHSKVINNRRIKIQAKMEVKFSLHKAANLAASLWLLQVVVIPNICFMGSPAECMLPAQIFHI